MQFNLTSMQANLTRAFARGTLTLQKFSPEILLIGGLIGIGGTIYLAAKATLEVEDIVLETKETIDTIKKTLEESEPAVYSVEDHNKDLQIAYLQSGMKFAKLYAPAIGLGVLSVGCILGSHGIMQRRNVALIGAVNMATKAFKEYRSRVIEELGEEKDRDFLYNLKNEEVVEESVDAEGKKIKKKMNRKVLDPTKWSEYARFFDGSSSCWQRNGDFNLTFLRAQQEYANDRLKARGHLYLNEVFESLGYEHTVNGGLVGWVYNKEEDNEGDGYVDFGIYDLGYSGGNVFMLDFNVDGIMYDLV